MVLDAEFPPSWSDAETDGGGSEGEMGGGTPVSPEPEVVPPKRPKKSVWPDVGWGQPKMLLVVV